MNSRRSSAGSPAPASTWALLLAVLTIPITPGFAAGATGGPLPGGASLSPPSAERLVGYTRIPNGIARASSSGDGRPPAYAIDRRATTFWRNRTRQTGLQYLEMDFRGARYPVARISLSFGIHYPREYRFRFKRNGLWYWGTAIAGNTLKSRVHVWRTPVSNVQAVRLYCLRYSSDDYFSVYEMVIER